MLKIKNRSSKTLAKLLSISQEDAQTIRCLVAGVSSPKTFNNVDRWIRQCYNDPSEDEQIMCAIDQVLGTCGVEHDDTLDIDYCNTGDSYANTVILRDGDYFAGSWGDLAERFK